MTEAQPAAVHISLDDLTVESRASVVSVLSEITADRFLAEAAASGRHTLEMSAGDYAKGDPTTQFMLDKRYLEIDGEGKDLIVFRVTSAGLERGALCQPRDDTR